MLYLFVLLLAFFSITLFGYVVHRLLHLPLMGVFHKSHMRHHILYPAEDYLSDKYRSAGKDSTFIFFAIASLPLLVIPVLFYWLGIFSFQLFAFTIFVMSLLGLAHNYLHNAFHIKNHWMHRFFLTKHIFNIWTNLHYFHHKEMDTNFGIFFFWWDKLFKTFKQ